MAHKTLIGGTAYEIGGGKTLVNGTAYSIDKGKTLVGGTAYEVGFAPSEATVTITGNGGQYATYILIDGVKYYTAQALVVPIGTVMTCFTMMNASERFGEISVNGFVVEYDLGGSGVTYDYTITGDISVNLTFNKGGGNITITEQ